MKQSQMTRFFCQELLYDYLSDELPGDRKAEVEAFLKSDEVCRDDLVKIKRAIQYCKNLSAIQTPDTWVERWQNLPPALAKKISDWELKIVSKLWTALPYTVAVVVIVLGIAIFKPWKTLNRKEVVLWTADMPSPSTSETPVVNQAATVSSSPTVAGPQQGPMLEAATAPASPSPFIARPSFDPITRLMNAIVEWTKSTEETTESILRAEELGPQQHPEKLEAEEFSVTTIFGSAPAATKRAEIKEEKTIVADPKGQLLRWFVETDDFDAVTESIKNKILELNGEKARKVELGWHSKNDESYFHFSLPESNKGELLKTIKTFGEVRMLTEKHPVVMPEGKIRIILIVKDIAEHDTEQKAETAPPAEEVP